MDYDDNDAQEQNLHLTIEGSSKVSPVLHSYPLPKFEFDDNLQEHLRFDSLVENEVFLGITSQEDNQWIEEYSRGTTAIPFNSSVAESRNQNVWSEATSSESVEMLLKSVGQEEKVLEETMVEEFDPNLKQSDGNDLVSDDCEKKVDKICDDGNQEGSNLENEMQEEDSLLSNVECGNVDASVEVLETQNEDASDVLKKLDGSEHESIDKKYDDANEEGRNLENKSFANELQDEIAGSSQNVKENIKEVFNENTSDISKSLNSNLENELSVNELQEDSSVLKVENASDDSKNFDSNEPEFIDKQCDDENQKGSDLGNESFVNELKLKEDVSVSIVESGIVESSQNMDATIEECHDISQEVFETVNEDASDVNIHDNESEHIDKIPDDVNQEGSISNLASEPLVNELQEKFSDSKVEESVIHNVEDISNKDEETENNASGVDTRDSNQSLPVKISNLVQLDDKSQSLEIETAKVDEDFTFSEKKDSRNPLDLKDMDMDVDKTSDSKKNIEESSSENNAPNIDTLDSNQSTPVKISALDQVVDETQSLKPEDVCMDQDFTFNEKRDTTLHLENKDMEMDVDKASDSQKNVEPILSAEVSKEAQGSEPNMAVVTDSVADVESSKVSSPDTKEADIATEDQPRSPILGLSLLQDDNEGKVDSGSLPVVKKDADSHSDLPAESSDVGPSEQTVDGNPIEVNNADAGGLLDPKESMTGEDEVKPLNLTVNISNEQLASVAVAGTSECENEGGSASLDKTQVFSFSDTKSIEFSQIAKDKDEVTEGKMENTPLPEIIKEGDVVQSVSSSSVTKEEKSFTFEVTGQTGIQNIDFSKVSSSIPSVVQLDSNKPHEDSPVTPQKPTVIPSESVPKKTSERKPRRKSAGKETAKKGNNSKETTTPTRHTKTDKSPPFITSENPNNSTSILQQSFTDTQQVQLRAQILVYGSLISGMSPEEPHMIAAFGQSDSGRKAWEAAWRACIERVHGQTQKSQVNNPQTPIQEPKIDSTQTKILSTPIITGTVVSPMNPIQSPLWNIPTPHDRFQSGPTPRTPLFDYRQTVSPLHPFQPQRVQTFPGHNNPSWPNQGPFPNQWITSSSVSPFTARFSSLPITESVKLTTVKESGTPVASLTPPVQVQHSPSQIMSPGQPSNNSKGNESKTRKRKKVDLNQTSTPSPAPVAFSTPKTNPFLSALSPGPSHGQPKPVDQDTEKTVTKKEIMSKIEESKVQATEAAEHATVAVKHCENVWSELERKKSLNLVTDDEAKLTSSAVSISAAASVAKVAAYAAKIASNVAEQAKLMADEVFLKSQTESQQAGDHSSSVISVARETARKRIEAASAASKHAENLDAIVKAAELAAEAVSQAGKIVAMGKPLTINELVETGPDGYWKTPQAVIRQGYSGNKQKVETASSDKKIQTLKHAQMMGTSNEIDRSRIRVREGIDLSKTIGATTELEIGPSHTSNADVDMPESASPTWKDNKIKEGCLVEVYKEDKKKKGGWFAANVLTLKDGKAFVSYTEIQSDDGSGKLKEWVPLDSEGTEAPRIRIAHPLTTMQFEGTKKRGRTVFSDYAWCSGDQVDVWVHDSWHEAVVVETNKLDLTSLTVQFPAEGKTSIVRSWHVRPTLIWKDDKWVEWSTFKGNRSSEGDTPQEKRQKFDKEKDKSFHNVNLETVRHQETRIPTLFTQGTTFDIGKTSRVDETKPKTRGPIRSGLQKERSRVVFGVPKPGKKQKFMDVSRHYDGDGSNKNNNNSTTNNSMKNIFINESKEKQVAEVKSKLPKFRKPPVPTVVRTLPQKDKSKSSVSDDEKLPGQQKEIGVDVSLKTPKSSTSKVVVSERLNKRKIPSGNGKSTKVEVKETLTSESEPRRSNRKIQPTSRLLEGLQSSLTISKMPTVSHASQRSQNKVMTKGSPRPV